jgi:hypothetical protein
MRELRGCVVVAALLGALALAPSAGAQAPAVSAALKSADAPTAQLETASTRTLPGGAVVSQVSQEIDGVPVQGAGSVVLDAVDAAPELLFDKSRSGLSAPGAPELSRADALAAAGDAVGLERLRGGPTARLVVVPGGAGTLAWETMIPAADPLGDFLVTVDTATGELLSRRNLIRRATGDAQLFVPNAVVENDGYSGIKDRRDRDSALLTSLRTPVTLENIENGQTCLKGAWARVRQGDQEKKVCKDSLDWSNVTRNRNSFEPLMAYHHVDQAQEYIQSLGLLPINAESQNMVANATMPPALGQDNSFYSPSQDEIRFGRGGVDDAEDADVIVHEYGHAVQFAQNSDAYGGPGNQAGAQGEGFGDYLAAAYSTERVGFDSEWTPCIMEWDATSYDDNSSPPPGICLRRADDPSNRTQQVNQCVEGNRNIHCVGQVWSSALLDLRIALGNEGDDSVMDTVVLISHQLAPPDPTFQEGSEALIAADESEYGAGDHCVAIRDELVARELLSGDPCD